MRSTVTKLLSIILSIIIIGGLPLAFAGSAIDDQLEFAGTLEETLGHFWALEMNLDEKNSKLALVHATHPIAELYETMNAHLQDNPEFDLKLQETLMNLQHGANTDVSREEAQATIDEAKKIINQARQIVVGELGEDPSFKMQSIMILLETAKVEYEEAVEDGIIKEVAEFQDGSAFVWRSQEIYQTIGDEIDPVDSSRIDDYYAEVWSLFDEQANPLEVKDSIDLVIGEFEELSGIDSVPSEHEEALILELPPLKQIREGIEPQNVSCKSDMDLIFKYNGSPACVNSSSVEKLIQRGWNN